MRALALLVLAGCMTPHSAVLGQTAGALGPGGTEVGLSFGGTYQSESIQPAGVSAQNVSRAFSFPAFEANGQVGIHERVGINLHASAAGLQPGAKITVLDGHAKLAILPQLGFGYSSQGSSTFVTQQTGQQQETNPAATTALTLSLGLKVLASHRSGIYGGVGYDFQSITGAQLTTVGTGGAATQQTSNYANTSHNLGAALGFDADLGHGAHLRPEVALLFTPQISQSTNAGSSASATASGYGFLMMPSLTFSVMVPAAKREGVEEAPPPEHEDSGDE